jgi:hypothetical protein
MKSKKSKSKSNDLMQAAKDSIKLGGVSMVGMGVMGSLGSIKGMPAQSSKVTSAVSSGLVIANLGQTGKNAKSVLNMFK